MSSYGIGTWKFDILGQNFGQSESRLLNLLPLASTDELIRTAALTASPETARAFGLKPVEAATALVAKVSYLRDAGAIEPEPAGTAVVSDARRRDHPGVDKTGQQAGGGSR